MKKVKILVLSVFVLLAPVYADAFGPKAHKVVALVAYDNLTGETRGAVDTLLALERDPGDRNIKDAATWADMVRNTDGYAYLSKLHYTNHSKLGVSYEKARDCPAGQCLNEAVSGYVKILEEDMYSPTEKLEALKLVLHFVADLHQPLHLGLSEDRGGNRIKVRFRGEGTNLHKVWDSRLVRVKMGRKDVTSYASELSIRARMSPWSGDIKCDERTSFKDWAEESRRIAMKHAYNVEGRDISGLHALQGEVHLSEGYIIRGTLNTEERLMKAGLRLACVLDRAFSEAGEKR